MIYIVVIYDIAVAVDLNACLGEPHNAVLYDIIRCGNTQCAASRALKDDAVEFDTVRFRDNNAVRAQNKAHIHFRVSVGGIEVERLAVGIGIILSDSVKLLENMIVIVSSRNLGPRACVKRYNILLTVIRSDGSLRG